MALVFADDTGKILRCLTTPVLVERYGRTCPGATQMVEFDEEANPLLARMLPERIDQFTIESGVLKFNGNEVPINEDRDFRKAIRFLRNVRSKLLDGTATQQERNMALVAAVTCTIQMLKNE